MCKTSLYTPVVIKLAQCHITATFVGARHCCNFWTAGIFCGSIDDEVFSDLGVANPDMHFAICCETEEFVVLVGKGVHRQPWVRGVNAM